MVQTYQAIISSVLSKDDYIGHIGENEFSEVIQIDKGVPKWIEITNRDALKLTHQRTDSISETDRKIILKELHPPIQTGELVGEMILQLSNGKKVSSSLIAKQASDKMTFWALRKNTRVS